MNPQVTDLVTRAGNGDKQAWDALVERYAPLIWSICRRHGLGRADASKVGQSMWLQLVDQLRTVRDPAAIPGWIARTAEQECRRVRHAARSPHATGQLPYDGHVAAERAGAGQPEVAGIAERELLLAERNAALREAFSDLPPACQQLITMLIEDPPAPGAEIGAKLGIPAWGIERGCGRCLDRLRQHPAVAAQAPAGQDGKDAATASAVRSAKAAMVIAG